MKKKLLFFIILLSLCAVPNIWALATEQESLNELDKTVQEELSNLDLENLNDITLLLDSKSQSLFKSTSFLDKVNDLISGESVDVSSFLSTIVHVLFDEFLNLLPLLCSIVAVALLCNIVSSLRSSVASGSVEKIINFVGLCVIVVLLFNSSLNLGTYVSNAVSNLKMQMDAIFPVLLTLVASIGGVNSVGVFQPLLAVVSNVVVQIFSNFFLPLVFLMIVFCVVNHMSDVKLEKFSTLFKSVFKWGSRGVFGVATLSMFVGGAMAGSFDNLSIKATHFALQSYVPVLGGTLASGVNLVAVSGMLIKNAVGVGGILLALSSIVFPIISVLVFSIGLKACAAILELSSSKIANLLADLSKVMELFITVIAVVGFMYLISLGILISTANIF